MKKILLLPVLLLAFTACTGNLSFNEEEIQEIAQSQPEGKFDVILKAVDPAKKEPIQIMRYNSSELTDDARKALTDQGWERIHSGTYEDYKLSGDIEGLGSIDPKSISAIEILKEITPEISDKYGEGSENGVVIITMKDEATQNILHENK